MSGLDMEEIWRLLRDSAGIDEGADLEPCAEHREFVKLGYDSEVVQEVLARIEREYGVGILAPEVRTPAQLMHHVNVRII